MCAAVIINNRKSNNTSNQFQTGEVQITNNDFRKISMYDEPPQNVISLHEFSQLAVDRLQVLKKLEFM